MEENEPELGEKKSEEKSSNLKKISSKICKELGKFF